ncbi:TldD/PmbA family protein [Staphylothermus hellenicus]|uniref:Peptidase U62 modulator of DNA gyrase n=1 Tax=Staphylothermus hellenicus (strain DSM 12710 / JCM 10830 / BK20S6-10-b1 / P8) TaxID=591019 RepID=D7D8G2_STAHD|nr:TldD/PmbA family protein [Staphylothermus hellenicus]ADI32058.1 peptidase U62 modulator of DNA gyrase [Staphylothermus hellenicus DSM 12710]
MREYMLELSDKIFNELLKRGVEEAEFYGVWTKNMLIDASRDEVKTATTRYVVNYGVRGAIQRRVAGIASEDLEADPSKLADQLLSLIKASPEDKYWPGFATGYSRGVMGDAYDEKTAKIPPEEAIDIMIQAFNESKDIARKNGAEESVITRGSFRVGVGGVFVANTYGENIYEEFTATTLMYSVKSRKAGEESSFDAYFGSRRIDIDEILEQARRAGGFSVKFIGAKTVPSGEYTVVIDPYMTALFLSSALIPAFSAQNIQQNRSPLKDKLEKQVLAENITITDEPGINWGLGTRSFDDEGIPTRTKTLVDKGVLTGYLYDYYTARKENRHSTGNGFRRQPSSPPSPSPTNFVLKAVKNPVKINNMLEDVGRGIIIHGMIGYWMSNYVNGAVQATITHGFYVENGEIKYPVKGLVVGGNIYDWLGKQLVSVSKEIYRVENTYAPQIIVEKARIASK